MFKPGLKKILSFYLLPPVYPGFLAEISAKPHVKQKYRKKGVKTKELQ